MQSQVLTRLAVRVAMVPGDVVLLDSYQVLHGRETFVGPREHAVLWLTTREFAARSGGGAAAAAGGASALSELVNRLAVKR